MADFGIVPRRPLRLGVATATKVNWVTPGDPIRVRGADLREVARKVADTRADNPGAEVVVDIECVIAADHRSAHALAPVGKPSAEDQTILYVGTPAGLAGLIADIRAIDLADGALLIPLTAEGAALIRDAVLPALATMTQLPVSAGQGRTA